MYATSLGEDGRAAPAGALARRGVPGAPGARARVHRAAHPLRHPGETDVDSARELLTTFAHRRAEDAGGLHGIW